MANYNLIFYDFEVFKYDWLVVFIDYKTKEKTVIINNIAKLKYFYEQHKDDICIGYNSRGYDQFVYKGLLLNQNPYIITSEIIQEGKKGYNVVMGGNSIPLNNFDLSTGFHSLKQLEAFMGNMIKESSVPFDIDRKLTPSEIDETVLYCTHDVEQTIEVFGHQKSEFDSQLSLIEAFDLDMKMFNKTKAQLSAHIIEAIKQHSIDDEFNFSFPDTLKLSKYKYVYDWYKNPRNLTYKRTLVTNIAGVPHTFAFGGVHGARENYSAEGIILGFDVKSLYPSLMIEYGYVSRNVIHPEKYAEIKRTRLKLKAEKNPIQLPYKIVLNATYGSMKDRNNPLYDPLMANNVCIAGQLLMLDLIEKVENYGVLLQSNTDGVYMLVENMEIVEKIKEIAKEWETRTRLDLDWEIYSKIYQRDVNNYIIVDKDGNYKSKGCVKKLKEIDYDLPIITKAVIEYCVNNTPIENTINTCNDLREFQKVVKISKLYNYGFHGHTEEKVIENSKGKKETKLILGEGVKFQERVLRVFASKDENAGGVYKIKGENKIEKIANTPFHCFIDNDNVIGKSVPEYLDKEYYIELANKLLINFIEPKQKRMSTEEKVEDLTKVDCKSFYELLNYNKQTFKVGNVELTKYIIANKFNKYGSSAKLIMFMDYYKLLNNKKIQHIKHYLEKYLMNMHLKSLRNIVNMMKLNKNLKI